MTVYRAPVKLLRRWWLMRVWYVHPQWMLTLHATPDMCLELLKGAAKPSLQKLDLRNLYAGGRRYHISPAEYGFRMTTTSKVPWRYRQRTTYSAVLQGSLQHIADDITRIELRVHIRLFYFIDIFLIPLFITSIIVYMPWHPLVIIGAVLMLLGLSWVGHRYNARLEAQSMIWYIQKVLEPLPQVELTQLKADNHDVISSDFAEAWQQFYAERVSDMGQGQKDGEPL